MNLELHGRSALVTAASRGLGLATAIELATEGARVMICGRDVKRLDEARSLIGNAVPDAEIAAETADVSLPADVARLVDAAVGAFGGIDLLVTNAGGPPAGQFDALMPENWQRAVDVTLLSVVSLVRQALPHLRRSSAASVLTITSFSAKQPVPNLLLSNVLRPAVLGLTKSLSQELGPEGIRFNSILPGYTRTERLEEIFSFRAAQAGTTPDEEAAKVVADIPLRRLGEPAEFGRVAAFLLSPAASYVNGVMLQVDGGRYQGLL